MNYRRAAPARHRGWPSTRSWQSGTLTAGSPCLAGNRSTAGPAGRAGLIRLRPLLAAAAGGPRCLAATGYGLKQGLDGVGGAGGAGKSGKLVRGCLG